MNKKSDYVMCKSDVNKYDLTKIMTLIDNRGGDVSAVVFPYSTPQSIRDAMTDYVCEQSGNDNISLGEPREWMEAYVCAEYYVI